jgi:hypothetical protein
MKYYCSLLIAVMLAQAAHAASIEQSRFAIQLFKFACIDHMGQSADKMAQWATDLHFVRVNEEDARKFLHGEAGTYWGATNPTGMFVLGFAQPSKCMVLAHEADTEVLATVFINVMEGVTRPGVKATKMSEKDFNGPKGVYHQIIYFVGDDVRTWGYTFILGTNPKDYEVQARLTATLRVLNAAKRFAAGREGDGAAGNDDSRTTIHKARLHRRPEAAQELNDPRKMGVCTFHYQFLRSRPDFVSHTFDCLVPLLGALFRFCADLHPRLPPLPNLVLCALPRGERF